MTDRVVQKTATVIGAGPAGLMAAETLATHGVKVTVYDRMPSAGRKFLLAGRGGLNLTHSEPLDVFLSRYRDVDPRLRRAIEDFPPDALRAWSEALGQTTFVGSSGRVFPDAMKASPLLRAWLRRLNGLGVTFRLRHRWQGWRERQLAFTSPESDVFVEPDLTVLALGGASWPNLGSDGTWISLIANAGIDVAPLQPANCGFRVDWSETFRSRFEGQPLKSVALMFDGLSVRGEAVVTSTGIEGGGIYALAAPLRDAVMRGEKALLRIDLRPEASASSLEERLAKPRGKQSISTYLRKILNLSPVAIGLLQEAAIADGKRVSHLSPPELAELVKGIPVRIAGIAPIARAISTAGGVRFESIDDHFMLRQLPGVFVAGEMVDWEAPTGGYLLQGCFATGVAAGKGALAWLAARS